MKHLKAYENITNRNNFWLITGNLKTCNFIYDKFIQKYDLEPYEFDRLSTKMKGVFFGLKTVWHFWEIEEDIDFKNGIDYFKNFNFLTFGGEVKYINGEIVIDPTLAQIDKYNV